ncbi:SDR family oxidoreductase [Dactylosporangium sucinum]|uniref:3-ketoacyl-ACP reductase n=1 Tax=Dactylosporangium sucinum TaxID=1424081 RepID=A0A917SY81_9ACTN|nr:SDR family oxidoreductase [Dactylosporangium sucinum]GGM03533.1 3-ketoacyl-ACP reductase [Dactylosporangium sucinum]
MTPQRTSRHLDGKVALVIGGSGDIGAAITGGLAAQGATTVVGFAHDEEAAAAVVAKSEDHGVKAAAIRADTTDPAGAARLVEQVVEEYGRLDVLVNVPGMVRKQWLTQLTDEEFDRLVALNLRTAFHALRAAGQHLADNGRCILLSTTLASVWPGPYGVYAATKAGVETMVRAAATELGGRGITVNAVAPGPIDNAFFRAEETPESITAAGGFSPLGRLGQAGDVAPVVCFLAGPDAGWISGQTIKVNGGMA